jgi:hypothetical protein
MSNPKDKQREHDEHDEPELGVETVKDLEPKKERAEAIRGGDVRSYEPMSLELSGLSEEGGILRSGKPLGRARRAARGAP